MLAGAKKAPCLPLSTIVRCHEEPDRDAQTMKSLWLSPLLLSPAAAHAHTGGVEPLIIVFFGSFPFALAGGYIAGVAVGALEQRRAVWVTVVLVATALCLATLMLTYIPLDTMRAARHAFVMLIVIMPIPFLITFFAARRATKLSRARAIDNQPVGDEGHRDP